MVISALVGAGSSTNIGAYKMVKSRLGEFRELFANQPEVKREIEYFKANIGSIETPKDLVEDYRLNQFVTTAFKMEDRAFAKAFLRKAIEEGTDDKEDLANRLVDPKVKEFANAFDYPSKGMSNLKDAEWVSEITERYLTQRFENDVGSSNEPVQSALYFERKAPTVTNWYQVLGDTELFEVARTVAGLPKSVSKADIDAQVALFKEKLDLEDFKSPAKLGKMIDRYLAVSQIDSGVVGGSSAGSAALAILGGGGGIGLTGFSPIVSIDPTLLLPKG